MISFRKFRLKRVKMTYREGQGCPFRKMGTNIGSGLALRTPEE